MPARVDLGIPDIRGRLPLLGGLAIDSFGNGCTAPLFLLFFNHVAHVPLGRAGVTITLAAAFSIVVPAVVGHVIDRYGPRNLVIAAQVAQSAAFIALFFARALPLLFVCALVMTVGQRIFWSSIFSLLSDVSSKEDRDRWFGLAGMMQAAGFGLGSLVAGVLLAIGGTTPYLVAIAVNAGTFLVAAWLLARLRVPRHVHSPQDATVVRISRDIPFLGLIGVNTIFALCSMVLGVGLPVFVTEGLPSAPKWIVGVLLAVVSVLLATGQTVVVRLTESRRRTTVLLVAAGFFACWGVIMAVLRHVPTSLVVPLLVVAILPYAVANLLHAATNNALAASVSPPAARGKYLSNWQYSFTVAGIVVPAFFAQLFAAGPDYPWLAAAGLIAVGAAGLVVLGPILSARAPIETARRS
jgi:MFS family permease